MHDEMVTRVAKAILLHVHIISGSFDSNRAARAAIEAMRDPPESMASHPSYEDGLWSRRNIEAFVDAALSYRSVTEGEENPIK